MKKIGTLMMSTFILIVIFNACTMKENADLILHNGMVYTVDSAFSTAEAFAVRDGKIIAVGSNDEILSKYTSDSMVDARQNPVYPGFIDAHCHFYGYGLTLQQVDLRDCKDENEVFERVKKFAETHPDGWIEGRGWDQNDWPKKEFPSGTKLSELFPDRPIYLRRIDGHAALVNAKAIELANINSDTKVIGGLIYFSDKNQGAILIDMAMTLVENVIPKESEDESTRALLDAQKICFSYGLTTIDDAGLHNNIIHLIDQLQKDGALKMRIYAMLEPDSANISEFINKGIYLTERLSVRSVKLYADGALGSRGAYLLEPYSDEPDTRGLLLMDSAYYYEIAKICAKNGFQLNTHAIGDAANQFILTVYSMYNERYKDLRWRIEHAQVLAERDFDLFGNYGIIPSVQPTHATSDMYWAEKRLGQRIENAYAYKRLLQQNGWIPLGTDFPVEEISPFLTFYAAVFRKDKEGWPETGFQIQDALTREEALKGMTIWAAMANFEETQKGSIETGKYADFIIVDTDLMKCDAKDVINAKVLQTFIGGERVYHNK